MGRRENVGLRSVGRELLWEYHGGNRRSRKARTEALAVLLRDASIAAYVRLRDRLPDGNTLDWRALSPSERKVVLAMAEWLLDKGVRLPEAAETKAGRPRGRRPDEASAGPLFEDAA